MTRLTKKVLTWLLSAFAFMALALGIAFGRPQTKTASAETVTATWSSFHFEPNIDGTTNTRLRFNTPALAWTGNHNDASDDQYLAYTKINGRTVKEINEAALEKDPNSSRIKANIQPAGNFSFYALIIPESFTEILPSDIYSVSIEAGWTYVDNHNGNYNGNTYTTEGVRYDLIGSTWTLITNFIDLDGGDIIVSNQGELYTDVNCFIIRFGAHDSIASYMCFNDIYQKVSSITGLTYGEGLDYVTINGKTIGQIKAENPDYDYSTSAHPNIKEGGLYAPIFAHISSADLGRGTENFLQIFIPTDLIDPSTVTEIGLKARLFNYNGSAPNTKYGLSEDVTFVKRNGSWVDTRNLVNSNNTTISDLRIDGVNKELYKVDITSSLWNSTCDAFDYNYVGSVALRQNLFINGVSVHTINTTTDDSAYVYSTSPMTNTSTYTYNGTTYQLFANPVLLYGKGDTLTLWIHKNYLDSLEGTVTLTIGEGFNYLSTAMKESMSKVIIESVTPTYTVTVDGVAQTVQSGGYAVAPTKTPTKAEDENYTYTFDNWYIVDTDTVFDFDTVIITQDYNVESRFTATPKDKNVEVAWSSGNFEPNVDQTAYTRIRLNTTGVAWTVYVGNNTADQYLAYTKLNGRTVKEINEAALAANGSAELIKARLQNAGEFSFYGLYIPNTFTEILAEDIYTVTIEAGWQHEDSGTGNTYKNSTSITWYYRDQSFQQNTGANKDINETASFTFQNQGAQKDNDGNALNATCFILNTRNTTGLWTKYGNTIKVGNPVLNQIYINGKSIKEWNIEAQAAVDAGTATDMLYGSTHGQNSNAGGPIAVLPGYAAAEAHGAFFQIYIADNFLAAADIYSFEFKAGFSFMLSNSYDLYYMSEGVKFEKVNGSWVNANDLCTVTIEDYNGTVLDTQIVAKGGYATAVPNPSRPTTTTGIYTFTGWKDSEGNDFSFDTPITGDITIIAQYDEQAISLEETDIVSIQFRYNGSTDNWLIFTLSNHDYACATGGTAYSVSYEELQRIGFLDNVILKGTIGSGSTTSTVSEATLAEIFAQNGRGEGRYINTWGEGTFGIRIINTPAYDSIKEIVVKAGTQFPSYEYACNDGETDTRFMVYIEKVFQAGTSTQGVDSAGNKVDSWTTPFGATVSGYDIFMADGAAIRITNLDNYDGSQNYMETEGYKKSGIRFQTWISKESLAQMQSYLADGIYTSVSFGTLIVPSADLVGGEFTHEWLEANDITYMDIASSAELTQGGWAFAAETDDKVTFFGSIVNLKSTNHNRYFSGVGYIAVIKDRETEPTYFYASYNQSSSRSASYIAQAAVADRSETQTEYYDNRIDENNNWSPYTVGEIAFLKLYMGTLTQTEAAAESFTLTSDGKLSSDASSTRNTGTLTVNKPLSGAYVTLNYQTNIDVWGKFYYQNAAGTKKAVEDFYLPKGSSQHKQYLDLFRYNGVGTLAGLTANDLYLTKIEFQNATVDTSSSGTFKFLGLYSSNNTLDTANLEVYVTKSLTAGGEMTVGAHLGLGGALTYLAKSGLYEGVSSTSSIWSGREILLRQNTSEFASTYNGYSGYYGNATSSKTGSGAVNLINNWDAGRQIQQSWYANVGGSLSGNTGANGYTRLKCTTGNGGYWPYNPVQAGDCESNPGQIIDYEVNEAKGYIYVKARAMDWAYGDTSKGGYEYGSTTKSYMENYYRLNADGTVYVNNSFVDWNGFTDMDKCDYQLVELPALYPVQTLNYFFTYDGASPWTGGSLTKKSDLSSWTGGNSHYQSTNDPSAEGKVGEEWVAWANDASGSVALGMYIPNINRFTSGRSQNAVTTYTSANVNAGSNYLKKKNLMSNMPAISYSYQSTYVQNTSYTAAGVSFRMEAYVPIEYTYVLAVNDINTIRSQFKAIYESGKVTNASSQAGVKAGLDAWARQDKVWTQV